MILPFSNYRYITPVMILLSILLVVALMILGPYSSTMLWSNWIMSLALTTGVWHIVSRFRLEGGSDVRAFAIALPFINGALQISYCYFCTQKQFDELRVEVLALVVILILAMNLWQQRECILEQISLGLIIGITSTLVPHIVYWLLLIPLFCYHMRCWSLRNVLAALTGILLGIWILYFSTFAAEGEAKADAMLINYATLIPSGEYHLPVDGYGVWQYLFLAVHAIVVIGYGISGIVVNVGQTVRTTSSIYLISSLCILLVGLLFADPQHMTSYLCLLAILTSIQITIRQANSRSLAVEWSILFITLASTALSLLPLFIQL